MQGAVRAAESRCREGRPLALVAPPGTEAVPLAQAVHDRWRSDSAFRVAAAEQDVEELCARLQNSGAAATETWWVPGAERLTPELQRQLVTVFQALDAPRQRTAPTADTRPWLVVAIGASQADRAKEGAEHALAHLLGAGVQLPTLAERGPEVVRRIVSLIASSWWEERADVGSEQRRLSSDAVELLSGLEWPGNTDQLERTVKGVLSRSSDAVVHCVRVKAELTGQPILGDRGAWLAFLDRLTGEGSLDFKELEKEACAYLFDHYYAQAAARDLNGREIAALLSVSYRTVSKRRQGS